MGVILILLAIGLLAISGVPGLFMNRRAALGQTASTVATVLGSMIGIVGAIVALAKGDASLAGAWGLPAGRFSVGVDAISVVFILPVFLVASLGSIYGQGYWKQAEHEDNGRKLRLFYGLLAAALAMVTIARDSILFLIAWEVMALAAFVLVTTEDDDPKVCSAGWVYLVATHLATLALIAMFALLRRVNGSFDLAPISAGISPAMANTIFLLTVIGFGLKAGIMPLHVWLPGAHANGPSHVSAIMSGVLIKMGVYGIVRITGLLPHVPLWWGGLLLGLGAVSGLMGILFAISQHDIKRLLAYCSIENVGIITMGLGLALVGRATERSELIVLGLAGTLLHVWNHSLFKSLLFFGSGSIIHAVHTRDMNVLGGLAKRMPRTAVLFVIGSVAICGLPPLNGFISELFIYLGLFKSMLGGEWPWAALVTPVLAMMGAIAVAAFVKLVGMVFLGEPRSESAKHAHDAPASMIAPTAILAALCGLIGLFPAAVAPILNRAVLAWAGSGKLTPLGELAPLWSLSAMGIALAVLASGAFVLLQRRMRVGTVDRVGTWDCGYAAPTPRMQYTASSVAEMLVRLFKGVLRPKSCVPQIEGLFPHTERFQSEVDDTVLCEGIVPALSWTERLFLHLRVFQQGRIQVYLLYILIIVVVLLWL